MPTNLRARFCDGGWSEEYDCVPLRLRLKMLRARVLKPDDDNANAAVPDQERKLTPTDISVKQEEDMNLNAEIENYSSPIAYMETSELLNNRASDFAPNLLSSDIKASGHAPAFPEDCPQDKTSKMPASDERVGVVGYQQSNNAVGIVLHPESSNVPGNVTIPLQDDLEVSNSARVQATKVKHEILNEFDDNLDNVVLRERRKMLVSRKLMQSSRSYTGESSSSHDMLIAETINPGMNAHDPQASKSGIDRKFCTINKCSPSTSDDLYEGVPTESRASPISGELRSVPRQEIPVLYAGDVASSVLSFLAQVKDEPLDNGELCGEGKIGLQNFFGGELLPVKSEAGFSEFLEDELDHLPLIDRARLLSLGTDGLDTSRKLECHDENMASAPDVSSDVLESVKPITISRPRKRRRTATNSVETALDEDAPGLLKVLIERGVLLEEMKLYGGGECEDALDDSPSADGFAELEAVISQLFSGRHSFLKFPLLRDIKSAKAIYCLSCLLALVEQTRYLQHRKWPVEWGWCRDLQSFIFVFKRHNRIVLERPEYGYATYFFELLNSVPVDWQVKRLVTAMKLTSCGRITLIENKPLLVGEDLSEGEARVLAEYGWTPNTGLGTMLNYCDRVVHDRKQEIDSSEWRSKIAKQLVNGYNGGNIVSLSLPKKVVEYQSSHTRQVKLE